MCFISFHYITSHFILDDVRVSLTVSMCVHYALQNGYIYVVQHKKRLRFQSVSFFFWVTSEACVSMEDVTKSSDTNTLIIDTIPMYLIFRHLFESMTFAKHNICVKSYRICSFDDISMSLERHTYIYIYGHLLW